MLSSQLAWETRGAGSPCPFARETANCCCARWRSQFASPVNTDTNVFKVDNKGQIYFLQSGE